VNSLHVSQIWRNRFSVVLKLVICFGIPATAFTWLLTSGWFDGLGDSISDGLSYKVPVLWMLVLAAVSGVVVWVTVKASHRWHTVTSEVDPVRNIHVDFLEKIHTHREADSTWFVIFGTPDSRGPPWIREVMGPYCMSCATPLSYTRRKILKGYWCCPNEECDVSGERRVIDEVARKKKIAKVWQGKIIRDEVGQ